MITFAIIYLLIGMFLAGSCLFHGYRTRPFFEVDIGATVFAVVLWPLFLTIITARVLTK